MTRERQRTRRFESAKPKTHEKPSSELQLEFRAEIFKALPELDSETILYWLENKDKIKKILAQALSIQEIKEARDWAQNIVPPPEEYGEESSIHENPNRVKFEKRYQ